MAGTVEKRLADLGITLPAPTTPVANYVPFVRSFLEDRFGNGAVAWSQLCARDVLKFVEHQARCLHPKPFFSWPIPTSRQSGTRIAWSIGSSSSARARSA